MKREPDLAPEGWVIAAAGHEVHRRFQAPISIGAEQKRPWVVVRPLTAREALQREAAGLQEELEIGTEGAVKRIRRNYDLEAMVEFDLERCLVDYHLPVTDGDDGVRWVRKATDQEELGRELLDRLPAALMNWLMECVDAVNMRRPEDVEVLAQAKKL